MGKNKARKTADYLTFSSGSKSNTSEAQLSCEIAGNLKQLVEKYGTVPKLQRLRQKSFVEENYPLISKHWANSSPNFYQKRKRLRRYFLEEHATENPDCRKFWRQIQLGANSALRGLQRESFKNIPGARVRVLLLDSCPSTAALLLRSAANERDCPCVKLSLQDALTCSRFLPRRATAALIVTNESDSLPDLERLCDLIAASLPPPGPDGVPNVLLKKGQQLRLTLASDDLSKTSEISEEVPKILEMPKRVSQGPEIYKEMRIATVTLPSESNDMLQRHEQIKQRLQMKKAKKKAKRLVQT